MKKIPTLFERTFDHHHVVGITPDVHPGCEWVMKGEGEATVKIDGACCAILGGLFYARYDAKAGKNGKRKPVPAGAIPCQEHPDPVTGHFPFAISAGHTASATDLGAMMRTFEIQCIECRRYSIAVNTMTVFPSPISRNNATQRQAIIF